MLQQRQMTMGNETQLGDSKQRDKSKHKSLERGAVDHEELKKFGSSPEEGGALEGSQHFGSRKQNMRRARKVHLPPGLSDDDFADLDY